MNFILNNLIYLLVIFFISAIFVSLTCNLRDLKKNLKRYLDSIKTLSFYGSKNSNNEIGDLKLNLDRVSIDGLRLLKSIFLFSIAYIFSFLLLLYKKEYNSIFLIVFPILPYVVLFKKK